MPGENLVKYIRNELAMGRTEDVLRPLLLNAGWAQKDIDEAFAFMKGPAQAGAGGQQVQQNSQNLASGAGNGSSPHNMMMVYNQYNLPLSPRKVIKKNLLKGWWLLFLLILFGWAAVLSGFIFTAIAFLVVAMYQYLYFKYYRYQFDDADAEITKGVVSRATGHVQYARIQNVYVDQDILDRIFGLYDVHYETAGEASRFYSHVDGLPKDRADILFNFLKEKTGRGSAAPSALARTPSPPQLPSPGPAAPQAEVSSATLPVSKRIVVKNTLTIFVALAIIAVVSYALLAALLGGNTARPTTVIPFFWLLTAFFVSFLFAYWYSAVWYKNFRYSLGPDQGDIRSKVISQKSSYFYYNRIQNVDMRQDVVDRLFSIYTVIIETAGERSNFRLEIPGLPRESAERVKNVVVEKSKQYKNTL